MEYFYKELLSSDTLELKELLKVFALAFDDENTYQKAVPSDTYIRALLQKQHFIALVALSGEKVIGGIAAYELEKFEQERKEIYIYDLAVLENYRRKGVATGLVEKLKEVAYRRGAYVIYVQADRGDEAAIKLYEKLGTREDVYHFDIIPKILN